MQEKQKEILDGTPPAEPEVALVDLSAFKEVRQRLKLFEMNKVSGKIKEARIVPVKNAQGQQRYAVVVRSDCRYTAARSYSHANERFVEMITGRKYSEVKREWKKFGGQ